MSRDEYKKNIPAGEALWTDFGKITAPIEQGTYTLYQHANEHNNFMGWEWVNEQSGEIYRTKQLWRNLGLLQ